MASTIYQKTFPQASVVNAETDTVAIPVTIDTLATYSYAVKVTANTGTISITLKLQESNADTGDDWYDVESVAISAAGLYRIASSTFAAGMIRQVEGRRQRLTLEGAGTQDTLYDITATLKG